MADDRRELRVGMFSLIGVVLMCGLVLLYGEEPTWFWRTHWILEIRVSSPQGIGEGTPAFLQGVQVGRVRNIRLRDMEIDVHEVAEIVVIALTNR